MCSLGCASLVRFEGAAGVISERSFWRNAGEVVVWWRATPGRAVAELSEPATLHTGVGISKDVVWLENELGGEGVGKV